MTTYDKTTLKTFFEQADIPSGTDYANFIDSQVNIAETAEQVMVGKLNVTKLITPLVSATTGDFTTLNANTLNVATVSAPTINATTGNFTNIVTTNVSATGAVYTSAVRSAVGNIGVATIISAAGTTRATAAQMTLSYMLRGQGVVDGTTTGFALPVPVPGYVSFFINDTAVSANLYPGGTDYTINALASGAAFALAARTGYTIMHYAASAYTVK